MIRNLLALTGLVAITLVSAIGLQASGYFDDGLDGPPPQIAVSYAGLDLGTREGVGILEGRVNGAINQVCPAAGSASLVDRQATRDCRRRAVAMVGPQIDRAIAAAEARGGGPRPAYDDDRDTRDYGYDDPPREAVPDGDSAPAGYDRAEAERLLPPIPGRPPVAAPPPPPPPPGARLIRRTVTTTVVTTRTGDAVSIRPVARSKPAKPFVARRKAQRSTAYARLPERPGSWLPPAAWRAIERANVRAFATGRFTPWASPGRRGYVTLSAPRRIGGATCRNLRVVKYNGRQQIVVAEGTRCRDRNGRITPRNCPDRR